MSPQIRRYLCEAPHCMIKASDAADNVDCHGAPLPDLDLESPTHRRAFAFPIDFNVRTRLARMTLS